MKNPEAGPKNIFSIDLGASQNDYLVRFLLNLLEACCLNEEVTAIIPRILLNNLYNSMEEQELALE
jgi:hypothetical protein